MGNSWRLKLDAIPTFTFYFKGRKRCWAPGASGLPGTAPSMGPLVGLTALSELKYHKRYQTGWGEDIWNGADTAGNYYNKHVKRLRMGIKLAESENH